MGPRKIVFISPIVPARSGNGLAMRMGMFVEALCRIGRVDVIVVPVAGGAAIANAFLSDLGVGFHPVPVVGRNETPFSLLSQIEDGQARLEAFRAYGKPSLASFLSLAVLARIGEIVKACAPDFVHVGRSYMAPCAALLPERIIATIDLDEDDLASYASQARLVRARGEALAADWLEQEGVASDALISRFGGRFRHAFVSSRRELLRIAGRHPGLNCQVVENAVDIPVCSMRRDDGATLMFVGSLSYAPNMDGILWFSREVLPRLRAMGGEACRLFIAGSHPPRAVTALERYPRTSVLGRVPDIAALYGKSTIALAPLRAGGGTRIKLLEAAAHGVATVSTPIAAEGLFGSHNGAGWIAATPAGLAEACREALVAPHERNRRAKRALDWVRRHHERNILVSRLSRLLTNP